MTSSTAIALVLAICVVALIPLAVAYWKPRFLIAALPVYALLLGVALYPSLSARAPDFELPAMSAQLADGVFADKGSGALPTPGDNAQSQLRERCGRVVEASEEAGLIVDAKNPSKIVVKASLWAQLPQQIREPIIKCFEAMRSTGTGPVEVVER